jgi:Tol biopolymer transport system component
VATTSTGKQIVVVDATEGEEYIQVSRPVFSPDSKRLAYWAICESGRRVVVVDGAKGKEYDDVGIPIFSPDSKRVAYVIENAAGKHVVTIDGVEGTPYDEIGENNPVFSPDSKRAAYVAARGEKQLLVVDSVETKEYEAALMGGKLAFDGPNALHVLGQRGGEFFRVEVEIQGE